MPSSRIPGAATEAPWRPSTGRVVAVLSWVVPPSAPPSTRSSLTRSVGRVARSCPPADHSSRQCSSGALRRADSMSEPGRVGGHVHDDCLLHSTRVQHHSGRHLSNIGLHRIRVRGVPGSRHLGRCRCRQAIPAPAPALYAAPSATDRVVRPAGRPRANHPPTMAAGDWPVGTIVRAVAARRPT
jgi:hypothetical protein